MKRQFALFLILLITLALTGCGDANPDAPLDTAPHPSSWLADHPGAALATADFADCVNCHGTDLAGRGNAVSCFSCHAFQTSPPLSIHPASWDNAYIDHRDFATVNGGTTCAKCHGGDLHGTSVAPSCFATSFEGRGCHPGGPGVAPHVLDGTYLDPTFHGPDAIADLRVCQSCHGEPGGPGSNPRFNLGIQSGNGTGCEFCHGVNYAHPADWRGILSTTTHEEVQHIREACTLCHGVNLDGVGGVGVSCFRCHQSI